jgi:uncharacterized protein YxjI
MTRTAPGRRRRRLQAPTGTCGGHHRDAGVRVIDAGAAARDGGPVSPERRTAVGFLDRDKGLGGTRYQMREKLLAIGDDFWIETDDGQRAFKVNGKALRVRSTFIIESPSGEDLLTLREKKLHIRDTMRLEHEGETVATIHKALVSPLRHRFKIEVSNGDELSAKGNIVDHEYEIERDGHKIAEVSKRWFRVRDTYGIEVAPGENDVLILAAAVCIDEMAHD